MKRIFVLLLTHGLLVAMVGAGFAAYFYDVENINKNSFAAGTLDLAINLNGEVVAPITFSNIAPGDGYLGSDDVLGPEKAGNMCKVYTLTNTGSLPGVLSAKIVNVKNADNGCTEPEAAEGDKSCGYNSGGELGEYLWTRIRAGKGFGKRLNDWNGKDIGWWDNPLGPGESRTITICSGVKETVGNIIQSDSVSFDIVFRLDQVRPTK